MRTQRKKDDENEESSAPSSRTLARTIFSVETSTVIGTIWRRRIAIFFTLGLSLAKSGLSSNGTSTLHSSEYAEEMTASTFLGESKPLFTTSISRLSRRQVSLPMSFYASVRTTPRSVSKQYECQRNSFLLPVCRNVSACSRSLDARVRTTSKAPSITK